MSDLERHEQNAAQVRALQFVIGALVAGTLLFAAVVVFVRSRGMDFAIAAWPILSVLALAQAVILIGVRFAVVQASERTARRRLAESSDSDDRPWIQAFGGIMITGCALLEGAAFMFLIAYLIEGLWWTLAGAALMVPLMLLFHWPSAERLERWIARQRELAQLESSGLS